MTGQNVLITGGSSGLGLAIATEFASQSAIVHIVDIVAERGEDAAASLSAQFPEASVNFHQCDVTSWERLAEVFKEIGTVDYVFANAGIGIDEFYTPASGDEPVKPNLKTIDVNLSAVLYTVHLAIHYMRKKSGDWKGQIICTASDAGLYNFWPAPIYGASKHGVIGLVRATGQVMIREGIQINGIAPNLVATNMISDEMEAVMMETPVSSVMKGVRALIDDKTAYGKIVECSGKEPGIYFRDQVQYPDETTVENFKRWWEIAAAGGLNEWHEEKAKAAAN